jgi:hypothetical protein
MGDPTGRGPGRPAAGNDGARRPGRGTDVAARPDPAPPDDDAVLFLPPVPLATGLLLEREDGGDPGRIATVEVVVSTEDGEQLRIPLVQRHGAWWAP